MRSWGVVGLALLVAGAACATVIGVPDPYRVEANEAGAGGGDASSEAGQPFKSCAVCLPPVPDGWQGPFAVDETASCSGAWSLPQAELHDELDAGRHECTCICSSPPATCLVTGFSDSCGQTACLDGPFEMKAGECRTKASNASCFANVFVDIDGGGPCGAPQLQTTRDPPQWERTAHVCGTTVPIVPQAACKQGEVCAPERPASAALCILHTGTESCPPGWSDTSKTYYTRADDSRDCSSCSCTDVGAPCEIDILDNGCTAGGTIRRNLTAPDCTYLLDPNAFRLLRTARACAADGGIPTGSVVPADAMTTCCRRP